MALKEPQYYRKGRIIRGPCGDTDFDSINEAKRESRRLQMAVDGALGRGTLRVVRKLPPAGDATAKEAA